MSGNVEGAHVHVHVGLLVDIVARDVDGLARICARRRQVHLRRVRLKCFEVEGSSLSEERS